MSKMSELHAEEQYNKTMDNGVATANPVAWSITYGGDEPMTHPFYRKIIDSAVTKCVEHNLNVTVTETNSEWIPQDIECRIVHYNPQSDHMIVRELDQYGEPTGRVHAIMTVDITNIHIH